jgi:hypothetical protein
LLPITPAPITPTRNARSVPTLEGAADVAADVLETIDQNLEIDSPRWMSRPRAAFSYHGVTIVANALKLVRNTF